MTVQRQGSKNKNMVKSGRHKDANKASRPHHVKVARERHIKNALHACGEKFAKELEAYYKTIGVPPTKVGGGIRK